MAEEKKCPTCTGVKSEWSLSFDYCEEHNVCNTCGIRRTKLDHTPWGSRVGAFICKPCELSARKKKIKERQEKGFDHEYTAEVVCPYCGYEEGDSWEMSDSDRRECPDCEEVFEYDRIVTCEYTTSKIQDDD